MPQGSSHSLVFGTGGRAGGRPKPPPFCQFLFRSPNTFQVSNKSIPLISRPGTPTDSIPFSTQSLLSTSSRRQMIGADLWRPTVTRPPTMQGAPSGIGPIITHRLPSHSPLHIDPLSHLHRRFPRLPPARSCAARGVCRHQASRTPVEQDKVVLRPPTRRPRAW
jgi:hypothetical protein